MTGVLALDTSNYTTSAAWFCPDNPLQSRKLLDVPAGALGLRQSDALFQHIKRLPGIIEDLFAQGVGEIHAVGASVSPREAEGSYMPCFLAGEGQGRVLARALRVPFYPWSHQQGHLAAAAWSAGHEELLDRPFLAWHLSGGTTELLLAQPKGRAVTAQPIGGTTDISAGQLIDRTGVLLGLPFPAGKALDSLSHEAVGEIKPFPVKLHSLEFSLSGMENKVKALAEAGKPPAEISRFVLSTLSSLLCRATRAALEEYPGLPVLFSGGVASNAQLRRELSAACGAVFSKPEYASDNAMGAALLTHRAWEEANG